jgi:hypothetical protein
MLIFIFGFASEFCRNNLQTENVSVDLNIWLKEKWNPGEVKGLNLCYILCREFMDHLILHVQQCTKKLVWPF